MRLLIQLLFFNLSLGFTIIKDLISKPAPFFVLFRCNVYSTPSYLIVQKRHFFFVSLYGKWFYKMKDSQQVKGVNFETDDLTYPIKNYFVSARGFRYYNNKRFCENCFFPISAQLNFFILRTVPTNGKYFFPDNDYVRQVDHIRGYWNPKRKLGVTSHFSEITTMNLKPMKIQWIFSW